MAESEEESSVPGSVSLRSVSTIDPASADERGADELTESWLAGLRRGWRAMTHGTILSSIFTLLTTCLGAGTLSLPYAFARGGLITASAILLVTVLISIIVGFMLLSGKRYCTELFPNMTVSGYEDIAEAAFGTVGRIAVLATLLVFLFLCLIAYMIYTRDQLDLIVQFVLVQTGHVPACSPLANCAVLMVMAFIPIFPITLLRSLTPLQFTSALSVLCIGYVAIVVTVETITAWVHHGDFTDQDTVPEDHSVQLWPTEFTGLLTAISYCSLAFICHFNILPLQKELHNPTKARLNGIVIGTMVTAYILYNVIIFFGYFNFFDRTLEDVMLNYHREDILVTTARVALFFTLLFSYPVLLHPTRAIANRLLQCIYSLVIEQLTRTQWNGNRNGTRTQWNGNENGTRNGNVNNDGIDEKKPLVRDLENHGSKEPVKKNNKSKTFLWLLETWVLFGGTFLPASFVPNVGYVWNFVGSIGGTLILYIFPAACYLRLRYLRYRHRSRVHRVTINSQYNVYAVVKEVLAWLILGLGLLLLIVENYQAIDAVINATHTPSSLCYQVKCGELSVAHNSTQI